MRFIEDLKVKHLNAFVTYYLGKDVEILGYDFDPEMYFECDDEDKYIEGSDFQLLTIRYKVGDEIKKEVLVWYCEDEEFGGSYE